MADGEEPARRRPFGAPETDWSVVQGSGIDSPEGQAKLASLLEVYSPIVYRALRAMGLSIAEAEDVTQSFVVRLLEGKIVGNADPRKGSFCTFIVKAARDHKTDVYRDATRLKRGGRAEHVSLAYPETEALLQRDAARGADSDPYAAALRETARILIANVTARLRAEYLATPEPEPERFEALFHLLIHGSDDGEQARVAERLGMTKNAVAGAVYRMRKAWQRLGREEAARMCGSVEEARAMWVELRRLSGGEGGVKGGRRRPAGGPRWPASRPHVRTPIHEHS